MNLSFYLTRSKVRGRMLGLLFSDPGREFYLSELARAAGASAGNIQRELERFVADGLIRRRKQGKLIFYGLNSRHALFAEIRSIVLKTYGIEGALRELIEKLQGIDLALLYGSFARGSEHGESDIDLLVVSDRNAEKLYAGLSKLESRFNREVNPIVYSCREFSKKIAAKDSFVMNVLKQPHRILKGNPDEFSKAPSRKS